MLNKKQVASVCLANCESKTCRYLCEDENKKFYCLKKTSKKQTIDNEVKDFLIFLNKKSIDSKDICLPLGDNCKGVNFK
jgi:hypothetical protein